MQEPKNYAIVGASGLVGRIILDLLQKEDLNIGNLKLLASKRSKGKVFSFKNKSIEVEELSEKSFKGIDIAFFCVGSEISKKYIDYATQENCICIDSSSAYRMDDNVPLIIPEINPHAIVNHKNIISSPNCTTTIMLMPIFNIHKKYRIKRIIASTYQAASGGGKKMLEKLHTDTKNVLEKKENRIDDPRNYGFNIFLHESPLQENLYSQEEIKMLHETRKILEDDTINVSATCVRVPVIRTHSIGINIELENDFDIEEIKNIIKNTNNVKILSDEKNNIFPTPQLVSEKSQTYVGRIRSDISNNKSFEMWIVGDQLLKGAALNAVQIAKLIK
jgi:aspartate-semialdehyde dehydrogenase